VLNFGDFRLRVALDPAGPGSRTKLLEDALAVALQQGRGTIERVGRGSEADWLIRAEDRRIILVPAIGWMGSDPGTASTAGAAPAAFTVRSSDDPKALGATLAANLLRIARARQLLNVARDRSHLTVQGGPSLDLELLQVQGRQRRPAAFGASGRVLYEKDQVVFRISNRGAKAIDVTLLMVDASYGIEAIFPAAAEDNRLGPGSSRETSVFDVSPPFGAEQVVAIAVHAGEKRADFSLLAQPALEPTRGSLPESPLAGLLAEAMSGRDTRAVGGLSPAQLGQYAVRLVTWRTLPRSASFRSMIHQ
jgi:hypothetical protein